MPWCEIAKNKIAKKPLFGNRFYRTIFIDNNYFIAGLNVSKRDHGPYKFILCKVIIVCFVAYFYHPLSDNYVDLSLIHMLEIKY